jgi:hypothetical protein
MVGLYACISLHLHGAVLREDFLTCVWAKVRSRKIECKNIWDEDQDAILEEIAGGRREGLDHDEEA